MLTSNALWIEDESIKETPSAPERSIITIYCFYSAKSAIHHGYVWCMISFFCLFFLLSHGRFLSFRVLPLAALHSGA